MNSNNNNNNGGFKGKESVEGAVAEATTAIQKEELVKTLGRHARQRLDEERGKRREIQRLPEDDAAGAVAAAKANARGRGTLVVEPLLKKKKKKPTAPRKRKGRFDHFDKNTEDVENLGQEEETRVDRWMPDVSHLNCNTLQELNTTTTYITSTVVQLHGLPVGTTSALIRRFFSGLDLRRILLLLPNTTKGMSESTSIPELDACYDKPPRKGGLRVDRCDLRVLVVFESAPTASLAVQRSGEVIQVLNSYDTRQQDEKEKGACVAVTPLNKAVANYLVKYLAVDAVPGVPLEQTVQEIHTKLDAMVSTILWDAAIHELHWNASALSQSQSHSSTGCPLLLRPRHWTRARNPRDKESQYELNQQWQDYRTALAQQVDRLLLLLVKEGHPAAAGQRLLLHDPALLMAANNNGNPCWKLTLRCVDVLRREMERVDHAVTVSRRWKRLVATRGSLGGVN